MKGVSEYAHYYPLYIRIENRYWSTVSKRQNSGSTIVPQSWNLQQIIEIAGHLTVVNGE